VCDVADNDAVAVDVKVLNGVQCIADDVCAGDSCVIILQLMLTDCLMTCVS